ncbi:L-aspartate oxidase [Bradyrhizobium genosp. P]|uniref:L-aspartate oxidase n=1 Tax=Bradyrhizobium genosp. P TaxID=83641 RepID=UPI003CEC5E3F
MSTDISELSGRPVIIGGGAAGLMTALQLAPEPVVLVSKSPLGAEASSMWAQGGLAAAVGKDDDPALHLADTIAAGAGLCDEAAASRIVHGAPDAVVRLAKLGVAFDRRPDGGWRLGLEAAHGRNRIVHATGDGTGREIMRALIAEVRRTPSITLLEGVEARRLLVEDNTVRGVLAANDRGALLLVTNRVVIATGGIGGLFADSTNPGGCLGQGLALAANAGAKLSDLEFVQFHPTAFDGPSRPMPLLTEAIRGDGATLIDETGQRFMADQPGAELAPRDIVARAVWHHRTAGHRTFLDARQHPGADFARRYPVISAFCKMAGIDPANDPIPIRPAVHYHMGGIAVDGVGRSTVQGLWACGEAARTGLHGANRLASNSLMEAIVCAQWVAASVGGVSAGPRVMLQAEAAPPAADPAVVRPILTQGLGVLRDRDGIERTIRSLYPLARGQGTTSVATSDAALVGLMIAVAAIRREESRGGHFRTDFPDTAQSAVPSSLTRTEALAAARDIVESIPSLRSAKS